MLFEEFFHRPQLGRARDPPLESSVAT